MLQYYLLAEGLALGWTGTGRLIFSFAHGEAEFAEVADRILAAARAMEAGGWTGAPEGADNRTLKRQILRKMLARKLRGG